MTNHHKTELDRMRRQGATPATIAEKLDLPLATIRSYIYRHPLKEQENTCPACGKPVLAENRGKKRRFCSDACRMAWWNSHPTDVNKQAFYSITCQHCGKDFLSYGNKNRKYCSRECFLDAIHYHVRSEGQIVKKAVYIAIGINLDGKKDHVRTILPGFLPLLRLYFRRRRFRTASFTNCAIPANMSLTRI